MPKLFRQDLPAHQPYKLKDAAFVIIDVLYDDNNKPLCFNYAESNDAHEQFTGSIRKDDLQNDQQLPNDDPRGCLYMIRSSEQAFHSALRTTHPPTEPATLSRYHALAAARATGLPLSILTSAIRSLQNPPCKNMMSGKVSCSGLLIR